MTKLGGKSDYKFPLSDEKVLFYSHSHDYVHAFLALPKLITIRKDSKYGSLTGISTWMRNRQTLILKPMLTSDGITCIFFIVVYV